MEQPLTYLQQRAGENWLIGYDSNQLYCLTEALFIQFTQLQATPAKILIAEPHPLRFLAAFLAAVAADCHIFLCNPHWGEQESQQVFELVQPDLIWGQGGREAEEQRSRGAGEAQSAISIQHSALIMIPTGGSSGKIRFAIHTWETLTASVRGVHHFFGEKPINSFCILPLYHVSGLMQFLRSFLTGGSLFFLPYKALKTGERGNIDPSQYFISLVPTQLQHLLTSNASEWLSRFHTVLLGGAPAWQELLETARSHHIRLAPTYGMTETASQIVTLKPEYFLAGNNSSGQILPHASVAICSARGDFLGENQTGIITIQADSLCLGYYPEYVANLQYFQTDDLGFLNTNSYLHLVGRRSQKIITGGENVFPNEVEAAILATQLVTDVCVIGLPNPYWGEVVTAVYVPKHSEVSQAALKIQIEDKLSRFKQPQYWVEVKSLPRNAQGKINYEKLPRIAMDSLNEKQ